MVPPKTLIWWWDTPMLYTYMHICMREANQKRKIKRRTERKKERKKENKKRIIKVWAFCGSTICPCLLLFCASLTCDKSHSVTCPEIKFKKKKKPLAHIRPPRTRYEARSIFLQIYGLVIKWHTSNLWTP